MALSLNLYGWVKNCGDGSVEMLVSGPVDSVQQFISWSKRGPAEALVADVAITEVPPVPLEKFEIRK